MIFLRLLSRLPLGMLYMLTDGLYFIIYHVWGFRRELSLDNLRNSFPSLPQARIEQIARDSYRHACDLVAEIIKGAAMGEDELLRRVHIENLHLLANHVGTGKPVVLLASHHCNWEWLLLSCCIGLKTGVDAVYKPLRVAAIDRFMFHARSRFGGNPIPVRNFLIEVMKRRREARVIALVADQTPARSEEKHWTRFLNQDTAFFVGAESVARIANAPVYFVAMRRLSRGHYVANLQSIASPPYAGEGVDIIEHYARAAEAHIERHPENWLWMYRKWKYKKPLYD